MSTHYVVETNCFSDVYCYCVARIAYVFVVLVCMTLFNQRCVPGPRINRLEFSDDQDADYDLNGIRNARVCITFSLPYMTEISVVIRQ